MSSIDSHVSPSSTTELTAEVTPLSASTDPKNQERESVQQKNDVADEKSTKEREEKSKEDDEAIDKKVIGIDDSKTERKRCAAVSAERAHVVRRKANEDDGEPSGSKRRRAASTNVEMSIQSPRVNIKGSDNNDDEEVIREKCIAMLLKCMGSGEKAEEIAKKVELAIFNEIGDANDHRYRSRVRSRVANLTRNPAIGKQIRDGVISPEKFARMTAEELATPQLRELREHLSEGTMDEHMMGEKETVGSENSFRNDNGF
uniref:TFIIS central domain-containing protein n=2 Tax=Parascaris univalens TaxID=6257 RepID=A0A915B8Z3_PARUN